MSEDCVLFGSGRSLIGIVSRPDGEVNERSRPALILCNAGLVHHVGPHRMYVPLARKLTTLGFTVIRFDLSGLGDSLARADSMPFQESTILEVTEVMDQVTAMTGISRFCIMGLSSGALLSVRSALRDDRVVGAGILNPHGFVRSSEWQQHVEDLSASRIYLGNLLRPQSWVKAFTGKTNYRRLFSSIFYRLFRAEDRGGRISVEAESLGPELKAFLAKPLRTLLLLSEADRSLENLRELLGRQWRRNLGPQVQLVIISNANHTFANPVHQRQAIESITDWMVASWPA